MNYIVELKLNNGYTKYSVEPNFRSMMNYLPELPKWYSRCEIRIKHGNTILFYIMPGGEIILRR